MKAEVMLYFGSGLRLGKEIALGDRTTDPK